MRFDVAFDNRRQVKIDINHLLSSTSYIRVPVEEIVEMLHDICDDLDMVRPQDKKNLQEAVDRFNYLTKVEN